MRMRIAREPQPTRRLNLSFLLNIVLRNRAPWQAGTRLASQFFFMAPASDDSSDHWSETTDKDEDDSTSNDSDEGHEEITAEHEDDMHGFLRLPNSAGANESKRTNSNLG